MYAHDENGEIYVYEFTIICMALGQLKILSEDVITAIIKGLLMATRVALSKLFANFQSNINNSLMGLSLKGTTMEQITTIFEQALKLYVSASLPGKWMEVIHSTLNGRAVPN